MSETKWESVDRYICNTFIPDDPAFVLDAARAANLPPISVSAPQGKFLHLLAKMISAKSILEIGTLAGYSAIWLARALPPSGKLITLEFEPLHAQIARANFAKAGLQNLIDLRQGAALDALPKLAAEKHVFDLIFIDADKVNYPAYLDWSVKLSRPGTAILADNTVREGAVCDPASKDTAVQAVREYNRLVAAHPRLSSTSLQTVGAKGYDGFTLAVVV